MLRTEKEVLRGGERKASFCTPLRPGEKEKRRKDGGDRYKKETFVLSNTGDRDIYNILNVFFWLFSVPFAQQPTTPKRGDHTPPKICNSLYLYVCDIALCNTLQKLLYVLYSIPY